MYADIIPYTRLPRRLNTFTYKILPGLNVKPGMLVYVLWRKQKTLALVTKVSSKLTDKRFANKLKEIINIADTNPFPEAFPQLILELANYYLESPATIFKSTIQPLPQKKSTAPNLKFDFPDIDFSFNKTQIETIKTQTETLPDKSIISSFNQNNKVLFYYSLIKKALSQTNSIAFIFPTKHEAEWWYWLCQTKFNLNPILVDSDLSKTKLWEQFKTLNNNQANIIIGTKLALFTPCPNLKTIVLDSYESPHYKQTDQTPRFDTRVIADIIQALTKCQLVLHSQIPRLQEIHAHVPIIRLEDKLQPVVINMRDELRVSRHYAISNILHQAIEAALEQNQQVLLITNKKGALADISCQDCHYSIPCPQCQSQLYSDASMIRCRGCDFKTPTLSICPNCHGNNIKQLGFGSKKLETILKKYYPNITITRFDSDQTDIPTLINQTHSSSIIIATPFLLNHLHNLNLKSIKVVGVISADSLLNQPGFNAQELTMSWLSDWLKIAITNQAKFFVQTFAIENELMANFTNLNLKPYYQAGLSARQALQYPPFGELIVLINKHESQTKGQQATEKIYQELQTKWPQLSWQGPFANPKDHKWYRHSIILKLNETDAKTKIKTNLREILPNDWLIDVNPQALLPIIS